MQVLRRKLAYGGMDFHVAVWIVACGGVLWSGSARHVAESVVLGWLCILGVGSGEVSQGVVRQVGTR